MKNVKLAKITALVLSFAVILASIFAIPAVAADSTAYSAATDKPDTASTLTLDALGARFNAYDKATGRINGVKLGEAQGIHLEASTAYTISFEYRLDEIIRPDNTEFGCSYNCRTPIMQVYADGKNNPTNALSKEFSKDNGYVVSDTLQNPWDLTVGQWYELEATITTAETVADNAVWFAFVSFGGMKSSIRNIAVTNTATAETTYYSIEKLKAIPAFANMNAPTYNNINQNPETSFPEIKIYRETTAAVSEVDNWSTLTFDALGARFNAYDKATGRINGVKLGEAQGIHLEASTAYTISFEYRLDEIIRPDNTEFGCSYGCRTPIIQVYANGKNNPTNALSKEFSKDNGYVVGDALQNPWDLTVGQWYELEAAITTAETVADNAVWFAFVSYGGMKSSIRNIAVTNTATEETTYYSIEKLKAIPAFADMNAPTYNNVNQNPETSSPEIKISRDTIKADITLDALGARYTAYDKATGRINGLRFGEAEGIRLEADTTYTISFEYRVDTRLDPTGEDKNNAPDTGLAWNARTPIIQVYADGRNNPTNALIKEYDRDAGGYVSGDKQQNPWHLTVGQWYAFEASITTAETVADNAIWFAFVSYGGMKSSIRNIAITPAGGTTVKYYFGDTELPEVANMNAPTYNNENQNSDGSYFPEILISKRTDYVNDYNKDGELNLLDLISVKKAVADISTEYDILDMVGFCKYLLGIEA